MADIDYYRHIPTVVIKRPVTFSFCFIKGGFNVSISGGYSGCYLA